LLLRGAGAADRDAVIEELRRKGIETRPTFSPLHLQPPYISERTVPLPVSEDLARRGLSLPSSSTLQPSDALEIASDLLGVLDQR
jgi:perosamine synthetase